MDFLRFAQTIGEFLDAVGVLVILAGTVFSSAFAMWDFFRPEPQKNFYQSFRRNVGRSILLGLEFLVAGDIIRSITGTPSFTSVGVLAIIVLVRSFLSITFDMEIEGVWPWQKGKK